MKLIILLCITGLLTGCKAENINTRGVTEYRLSDFSGTMAYASEADESELNLHETGLSDKYDDDRQNILSEFSTKFNKRLPSRVKNVLLASNEIDEEIVYPGEMFSFNETVGPTNKETGYQRSKIFIKGKEYTGYGGGVCQVSSTLYNAVNEAGLKITERHPHSKDVSYVPKNQDAAVSYGGIDLKFVNEFDFPIKINSKVVDDKITISIESLLI